MNEFAVVACLTAFPTLAMIGGALIVVWKEPGERLTAILQQFAGIVYFFLIILYLKEGLCAVPLPRSLHRC